MSGKIYISLALINLSLTLFAQEESSSDAQPDTSVIIKAFRLNPLTRQADTVVFDTTMQEFYVYNHIYKNSFSNSFLGNNGQAYQSNDFLIRNTYSPFVFEKPFLAYLHSPFSINHFNTRKPFTRVEYVTFGSRDISEQVIGAIHSQNFNEYTNFGLKYDLVASRGIYLNQGTKANRFTFFGSYDKDAYSIYGSISLNKLSQEENGGLIDIPQFEEHIAADAIAYRMYLEDAGSKLKKNVFFITQTLDIQENIKGADSLKMQSNVTPFHVNHTLSLTRFVKTYDDVIPFPGELNFYTNNYYQINEARDSAYSTILENSFQISGDKYKFLPGFIAGIKHQYQTFGYRFPSYTHYMRDTIQVDTIMAADRSTNYHNIAIYASILDVEMDRFKYLATIEYYLTGFRQNDLMTDITFRYSTSNNKSEIIAGASLQITEPDFFLKRYNSSHFQWDNDLFKISNTGAKIAFSRNNKMFYLQAGLNILGNYVYLDTLALPALSAKSIILASLHLEKKFSWKGFNMINKLMIQSTNPEDIINVPLVAFGNTTYYENAFFKKVLKVQLGFDFYYHTTCYADAFMPATGMFFRQEDRKIGDFPFLDAFLNWKIKRTRFFLKYTNTLAGITGYNYFTAYGYPMNERGLRFGLSWTFYD